MPKEVEPGPCGICHGLAYWLRGADWLCCSCHPMPTGPMPETVWFPAFGWKKSTDTKRLKGVIYDDEKG